MLATDVEKQLKAKEGSTVYECWWASILCSWKNFIKHKVPQPKTTYPDKPDKPTTIKRYIWASMECLNAKAMVILFHIIQKEKKNVTSKYDGRFKWIISRMVIFVKLFLLIKL